MRCRNLLSLMELYCTIRFFLELPSRQSCTDLDITVVSRHRVSRLMIHRGQGEAGHVVHQLGGGEVEPGQHRLEEEPGGGHIVTRDIITRETHPRGIM